MITLKINFKAVPLQSKHTFYNQGKYNITISHSSECNKIEKKNMTIQLISISICWRNMYMCDDKKLFKYVLSQKNFINFRMENSGD